MRDAVRLAVDGVVRLQLEVLEHVGVVRDQVDVDRCDLAAGDEAERRVAGRRHAVVLAGLHELHHLVGRVAELDVDRATGGLLELGHPVDGGIGRPVLDVTGPGDQVDLTFALTELGRHAACGLSARIRPAWCRPRSCRQGPRCRPARRCRPWLRCRCSCLRCRPRRRHRHRPRPRGSGWRDRRRTGGFVSWTSSFLVLPLLDSWA